VGVLLFVAVFDGVAVAVLLLVPVLDGVVVAVFEGVCDGVLLGVDVDVPVIV
jgi:hypothetical protein